MNLDTILQGDALAVLKTLPEGSVNCCVTSPPYFGLRDYGTGTWEGGSAGCDHKHPPFGGPLESSTLVGTHHREGFGPDGQYRQRCGKCGARRVDAQLGLEATPDEYVERMVEIFREVRRVLRSDATLWLNLGDSYSGSGVNDGTVSPGLSKAAKRGHPVRRPGATARWNCPLKPKDMVGIPWRVAFALQADGWWLRRDLIWHKPNPMPESVTDRPTSAHEYLFILAKSQRYYYDGDAIAEPLQSGASDLRKMAESLPRIGGKHKELDDPLNKASGLTNVGRKRAVGGRIRSGNLQRDIPLNGNRRGIRDNHIGRGVPWEDVTGTRNARSVWTIATTPFSGAHFATFPEALVEPCIMAGCPAGGVVLDPFMGSGTVAAVAMRLDRHFLGIDLNADYIRMAEHRLAPLRAQRRLWPVK